MFALESTLQSILDDTTEGGIRIVSVTAPNGRALPDSLRFSPATGEVIGTVPAGLNGLTVRVTVQMADGSQRVLEVILMEGEGTNGGIQTAPQPAPAPTSAPPPGDGALLLEDIAPVPVRVTLTEALATHLANPLERQAWELDRYFA